MKNVMDYGKARGMALVSKCLPELNIFQYMDAVGTLEEWEQVREKYGETMIQRIDYPSSSGEVRENAISGTNGLAESMPEYIAKVRKQGESGVVLVAHTDLPHVPRSKYLGGFNILFCMNHHLTIELVGKAFDGHELTMGLAQHEIYNVTWNNLLFATNKAKLVRVSETYRIVSPDEYQAQREARVRFLVDECCEPADQVEQNVPRSYVPLNDDAVRMLLNKVVLELYNQCGTLKKDKLTEFGIQGNIVEIDGQIMIQPWEIFRPERWS